MVRDAKSGHLQMPKLADTAPAAREAQHIHPGQPQHPHIQAVLCLYLPSSPWHGNKLLSDLKSNISSKACSPQSIAGISHTTPFSVKALPSQ